MRIAGLFVEGKLDSQLLGAVFGLPIVGLAGKQELPNAVRYAERYRTEPLTGRLAYVRDRDFDADPPGDPSQPVRVQHGDGVPGWTWCRHEIENYLLEPALVASALGCDADEYKAALATAANSITTYAAARWAIGHIRAELPRSYELETKPHDLAGSEFRLPADLSAAAWASWLNAHTAAFREQVQPALEEARVQKTFEQYRVRRGEVLADTGGILVWLPGKDLMGALGTWLAGHQLDAGRFRSALARWVREHPEQTLDILGEWRELVAALRSGD